VHSYAGEAQGALVETAWRVVGAAYESLAPTLLDPDRRLSMLGLLVGAIAGGLAGYYWRDTIRNYMSNRAPDLRKRAADGLGTLGERAGGALDRARSRIDTTVRTGQEWLRAADTTAGSERRQASEFGAGYDPRRGEGPSSGGEHHQ
jgi:hypothetical protein